jgi:hypothetical protein
MFSLQAIGLLNDSGDYDGMVPTRKVGMSSDTLGMENP